MRIRGRHIVWMTLASLALAGCQESDDGTNAIAENLPPIISGVPATSLQAGSPYSFTPSAADPEGDALTFRATNVPSWASFNTTTGALTGTPSEANVGMTSMITIEVSDAHSVAQLPAFRINVSSATSTPPPANVPPTIVGTPATTATVGQPYTFQPVGDDANNDTLTYSIQNRPSWATFTPATGRLAGTPISANVGTTNNIVITVSDGQSTASLPPFNLTVSTTPTTPPANRPPTITGSPTTMIAAGTPYTFQPVGSDPDGNTLTYSIQNRPSWLNFSTTTGRLTGTPGAANVGTSARITISVSDGTAQASLPSFTIQVTQQANRPPTISGSPAPAVNAGSNYSFQPSASDPDGNALTFSITNRPAWANFNPSTGALTGTPTAANVGSYSNITISVSDGQAMVSLPAFSINVTQVSNGSAQLNWTPPTQNTDGSTLTNLASYRVLYGTDQNNLDQNIQVNNAGATSYTVTNLSAGTWHFGVVAVTVDGIESAISNIGSKTVP